MTFPLKFEDAGLNFLGQASSKRRFLESIEAHVSLGVDPRRGDQV